MKRRQKACAPAVPAASVSDHRPRPARENSAPAAPAAAIGFRLDIRRFRAL